MCLFLFCSGLKKGYVQNITCVGNKYLGEHIWECGLYFLFFVFSQSGPAPWLSSLDVCASSPLLSLNIQQEPQHMTCNLANSLLLFNRNESSFVSVYSLLFGITVSENYTPLSDNFCQSSCSVTVSWLPSVSSLQYKHLFMKLVEAVESSYCTSPTLLALVLRSILTLDLRLPASQTSSDSRTNKKTRHSTVLLSCSRQPTCCFQEPPWITELRPSSRRTSDESPEVLKLWAVA